MITPSERREMLERIAKAENELTTLRAYLERFGRDFDHLVTMSNAICEGMGYQGGDTAALAGQFTDLRADVAALKTVAATPAVPKGKKG
jgi:hypothetical protein